MTLWTSQTVCNRKPQPVRNKLNQGRADQRHWIIFQSGLREYNIQQCQKPQSYDIRYGEEGYITCPSPQLGVQKCRPGRVSKRLSG